MRLGPDASSCIIHVYTLVHNECYHVRYGTPVRRSNVWRPWRATLVLCWLCVCSATSCIQDLRTAPSLWVVTQLSLVILLKEEKKDNVVFTFWSRKVSLLCLTEPSYLGFVRYFIFVPHIHVGNLNIVPPGVGHWEFWHGKAHHSPWQSSLYSCVHPPDALQWLSQSHQGQYHLELKSMVVEDMLH